MRGHLEEELGWRPLLSKGSNISILFALVTKLSSLIFFLMYCFVLIDYIKLVVEGKNHSGKHDAAL